MNENKTESKGLNILVVDDHELVIRGTIEIIQAKYPEAKIISAKTLEDTLIKLSSFNFNAIIMDICLAKQTEMITEVETGISLLQRLINEYSDLNIMVQTNYVNALVKLKDDIDNHKAGFTIVDKSKSSQEMLKMFDLCLKEIVYTKMLKTNFKIKPEWLEVLNLAFKEGLQDKAIASKMYKSERMIRNYWHQIRDILEIDNNQDQNIRILTLIRASQEGLIMIK
jgi:DNA-binding NarL/FixJ family response regulator